MSIPTNNQSQSMFSTSIPQLSRICNCSHAACMVLACTGWHFPRLCLGTAQGIYTCYGLFPTGSLDTAIPSGGKENLGMCLQARLFPLPAGWDWPLTDPWLVLFNHMHITKSSKPNLLVKTALMGLNLTPSAEVYLVQLGNRKLIHDGWKQKAAASRVMRHSKGVRASPRHGRRGRPGKAPLAWALRWEAKKKPGDHHFILPTRSTSKATDPALSPGNLFILGVIRTIVTNKIADNFCH